MDQIQNIARDAGIENLERLPRDVSPREYFRGTQNGRPVVLMFYPEVTEKNRAELQAFIRIGEWLRRTGLYAPEIYMADEQKCFALLEDLGRVTFGAALREGGSPRALYPAACDDLIALKNATTIVKGLPLYWDSRIHENRRQILDYYLPVKTKRSSDNNVLNAYLDVLNGIEKGLPPCKQGFLHADFHLENLMVNAEGEGLNRCGIIDFQDALLGPQAYDLVNLLEDARVDVPMDLKVEMVARYCQGMDRETRDSFMAWYRFLGTQFHCRVIGLFIKLAVEQGRDQYLVHIPRLQAYIADGIEHPVMAPLKTFFEKEKIDFLPFESMNGAYIRSAFQAASS